MSFNFKKALKRIVIEELKGNNPVPDILSFFHLKPLYEDKLFNILENLFNDYEDGNRSPIPLLKIDVPKPNFTIRPMSRPETKDWILYEAIVESISNGIMRDKNICKRSYSFLNFLPGTEKENNWIKFDDRCREFYTLGNKYAVVADLTGYYENISLSELRKRIINYIEQNTDNEKLVNVLHKMLNKWSDERVSGYGLPQGPPASSFLADIYLDHVDNKMEKHENYVRYMDDIRIFCKTEIEAKKSLKELIIALRSMKLNINAKKTKILHEKDIEAILFDPLKSSFNLIDSIFKNKEITKIKMIIPSLIKSFESAFLDNPFEKSHLNFSLYRLSTLQASGFELDTGKIISLIKENIISKPHHTGLFCYFLTLFPRDRSIADFLIKFLKSEDNIYEGQEIKVLQCLLRFNMSLNNDDIKFSIESAKDSNRHFATRGFYFLLVGKYGTNRDRDLIVDLYDNSYNDYLKTSMILAVQELGHVSRNEFYARIKSHEGDNEITKFINYVKSLKHPLYYLDKERPKIESMEELEPSPY